MDPRERINEPEEAQRAALDGRQARIRTAGPGIVTAVNLAAQTVTVQLAIQGAIDSPDGTTQNVNMPLLADVPICWPRAGGFALTMPIAIGDEVLVVYGDRCIDSWWQSGGIGAPLSPRMHDLSDAFAILAPTSQPRKLANVSTTAMQMRNEAGTAYIELTAAGAINLVGTAISATASGAVGITSASLRHNTVNVGATHVHGGVAPGASNTTGPT